HAPYSAGEELYGFCFAAARKHALPLASHLAESADEEELLVRGTGRFADFFRAHGFVVPRWSDARLPPFARVRALAPPRGFVVNHGNALSADDLAACAREGWPLVHCPRSHRYFGHARSPVRGLLAAGGVLALGTGSRASNAGLDLWAEMACLR